MARLDESLQAFFERRLDEPYPYLILDARYEKVREAGVITSQAVLVAIGVGWDGWREVLGVELANRESRSSWRAFVARPQATRPRRRRVPPEQRGQPPSLQLRQQLPAPQCCARVLPKGCQMCMDFASWDEGSRLFLHHESYRAREVCASDIRTNGLWHFLMELPKTLNSMLPVTPFKVEREGVNRPLA